MAKTRITTFLCVFAFIFNLNAASYGLPQKIEDGNILHCFNWSIAEVRTNLANIAAAGYGSVQLSPLQRADIKASENWSALYRPYDLAYKASPFMGSESDLKALCADAAGYGIKVIVDVVANHVDKTSGYHDTWWDTSGRIRWNGGINYNDRYSITHGQLGDYGDINSESPEVQQRIKAYIQFLKDCGVSGIRWDAAKHIALPSEGCNFWNTVTSVSGLWHYGEILDAPGPESGIIREYVKYMAVTDNRYSNNSARNNGGIPTGYGGTWVVDYNVDDNKIVYWGESHDTYANDEWSQNIDQSIIDRAYASIACRQGAIALYLARPNSKGFNNIRMGKGTDAYKRKAVAEVNKFRNAMVGKPDYFTNAGNAISVTRKDGGAVVVMKGSGNIAIANGGSYSKPGIYTDHVSGNKFTITASTISGTVGSTGIAVLYDGSDTPDPNPNPDTPSKLYIIGNVNGWNPSTPIELTKTSASTYSIYGIELPAAENSQYTYFSFCTQKGVSWDGTGNNDGVNDSPRYGPSTNNALINIGSPLAFNTFLPKVNASACTAFKAKANTYDITIDFSTKTVTISDPSSVSYMDSDAMQTIEYFTLQGAKVSMPTKGIYIVRRGNKAWKEIIP